MLHISLITDMIMINLNLPYNCYNYVRKAISCVAGNHCTYSYYNNSYWLTSKGLMTSTPWWSQRTTPHRTNSRSVHIEQTRQQHHNRKSINISSLISIDIPPPNPHICLFSDIYLQVAYTATTNNSCCFINFNWLLILTITFCKNYNFV